MHAHDQEACLYDLPQAICGIHAEGFTTLTKKKEKNLLHAANSFMIHNVAILTGD
jgi:hypothetical protein